MKYGIRSLMISLILISSMICVISSDISILSSATTTSYTKSDSDFGKGLLFGIIVVLAITLVVFIYHIEEEWRKKKQMYIDEPELHYEERSRSVNFNIPTEFKNDGPIEINVRSSIKGPFTIMIDGKEAGTIEKQLKFIESRTGLRDITIMTKKGRVIYHDIHHVQQFTNITVYGFIIYYVRFRN